MGFKIINRSFAIVFAAPRNQFEVAEKKMQALLKARLEPCGNGAPSALRCHLSGNCPGYAPIELHLAFNGRLALCWMLISRGGTHPLVTNQDATWKDEDF